MKLVIEAEDFSSIRNRMVDALGIRLTDEQIASILMDNRYLASQVYAHGITDTEVTSSFADKVVYGIVGRRCPERCSFEEHRKFIDMVRGAAVKHGYEVVK